MVLAALRGARYHLHPTILFMARLGCGAPSFLHGAVLAASPCRPGRPAPLQAKEDSSMKARPPGSSDCWTAPSLTSPPSPSFFHGAVLAASPCRPGRPAPLQAKEDSSMKARSNNRLNLAAARWQA